MKSWEWRPSERAKVSEGRLATWTWYHIIVLCGSWMSTEIERFWCHHCHYWMVLPCRYLWSLLAMGVISIYRPAVEYTQFIPLSAPLKHPCTGLQCSYNTPSQHFGSYTTPCQHFSGRMQFIRYKLQSAPLMPPSHCGTCTSVFVQ